MRTAQEHYAGTTARARVPVSNWRSTGCRPSAGRTGVELPNPIAAMREAPASRLTPSGTARSPADVPLADTAGGRPGAAAVVRAALVDRDALARQRLHRVLERHGVAVVAEVGGGADDLALVARERPDVLFVDLGAPDLDVAALRRQPVPPAQPAPLVVAVAGSDEHAMTAFELGAVDYLVEPVSEPRLAAALERVRERLRERSAVVRHERLLHALGPVAGALAAERAADDGGEAAGGEQRPVDDEPRALERILVKEADRMYFVRVEEVDWVEAHGNYVRLHAGQQVHVLRLTMNALERRLPVSRFARIHRSTIVNLDRVREMQPWFSGDYVVHLHGGTRLKLSRVYRDRLEARLRG